MEGDGGGLLHCLFRTESPVVRSADKQNDTFWGVCEKLENMARLAQRMYAEPRGRDTQSTDILWGGFPSKTTQVHTLESINRDTKNRICELAFVHQKPICFKIVFGKKGKKAISPLENRQKKRIRRRQNGESAVSPSAKRRKCHLAIGKTAKSWFARQM